MQTRTPKKVRRTMKPRGFQGEHPINHAERMLAQAMLAGDTESASRWRAEWERLMAPAAPFLAGPIGMEVVGGGVHIKLVDGVGNGDGD